MFTMEKPAGAAKSKIKLLMFLPKPASAVSLSNQNQYLFSPGKVNANKLKSHQNKGFSGPITSIVFEEARNKSNSSSSRFDAKEPTSPKISCMGQIKHRKKMSKNKINSSSNVLLPKEVIIPKQKNPGSRNVFSRAKQGRKSAAAAAATAGKPSKLPDRAPSLSQMKRFASARDTFSKFDYNKSQVAPEGPDDPRYYSGQSSGEEEEEDREVIIPFSAPILRGEVEPAAVTLQPRKEINIWKRRTMAQPKPLRLISLVASS